MSLFTSSAADSIGFDDVVRVEDTPEILEFRCTSTGMPIWPNVRLIFFRTIMGDLLFSSSGSVDLSVSRDPRQAVGGLARAIAHNAKAMVGRGMRSDLFFNTEAVGDEWTGTEWYNRYVDPFVDVAGGEGTILLDMFEWHWREPRHSRHTYYHAPIQALSSLYARRPSATARAQAAGMVALLERRARDLLGWEMGEAQRRAVTTKFAAKIATLPFRYRAYRKLLKRVRPKVLVGSSGCYGIHAPLLVAAHDLGIVTAEYQHGAISEGHDAYNFADTVMESEDYRRTLPQYLLTYGDWWGQHVGAPVEKISIGYPARAFKLAAMNVQPGKRNQILLLSDGVEFELYLDLARAIAPAVIDKGLEVVVRPHPNERSAVIAAYGSSVDGVSFDTSPDIYSAFLSAHSVISEVSTGLFEAVGLVERIVLIDSAKARFCYPDHPYARARSAAEVLDIVTSVDRGRPSVDADQLWAPDWRGNFCSFLSDKAGIDVE